MPRSHFRIKKLLSETINFMAKLLKCSFKNGVFRYNFELDTTSRKNVMTSFSSNKEPFLSQLWIWMTPGGLKLKFFDTDDPNLNMLARHGAGSDSDVWLIFLNLIKWSFVYNLNAQFFDRCSSLTETQSWTRIYSCFLRFDKRE